MGNPPSRKRKRARPPRDRDPLEADFGPGPVAAEEPPREASAGKEAGPARPGPDRSDAASRGGFAPGIACAGEGCLLKPAADLVGRFVARRGGSLPFAAAAISGLELLRALRDFLDEEIALAERAAGRAGRPPRYEKIPVE